MPGNDTNFWASIAVAVVGTLGTALTAIFGRGVVKDWFRNRAEAKAEKVRQAVEAKRSKAAAAARTRAENKAKAEAVLNAAAVEALAHNKTREAHAEDRIKLAVAEARIRELSQHIDSVASERQREFVEMKRLREQLAASRERDAAVWGNAIRRVLEEDGDQD